MGLIYAMLNGTSKPGTGIFIGAALVFIAIAEGVAWILEGFANDR